MIKNRQKLMYSYRTEEQTKLFEYKRNRGKVLV